MTIRTRARLVVGTAAAAGILVLAAAPVAAHVEPTPSDVTAGSTITVSFGVEHGCEDSPTTRVEIKLPEGVTAEPVQGPAGWTGAEADGVITFEGGPQDPEEELVLAITATFPDVADTALSFPLVQTCEDGEISWIDPVVEGEDEPEHPAPTVSLTGGTGAEPGVSTTEGTAGTETTVGDAETSTTTAEAPSTTVDDGDDAITPAPVGADAGDDDGGSSTNTGLVVGGAIAVVVVLAAAGAYLLRRRNDPSGPTGDGA